MKQVFTLIVVALLGGVQVGSAQANSARESKVSIIATDDGFVPTIIDFLPGKVRVTLLNNSKEPHGLKIQVGGKEFGLDKLVAPGAKAEFTFTAPEGSGMGQFYSPGHENKKGFEGRVLVGAVGG